MWRKSRKPNPSRPQCVGADLNRNFDSHHAGIDWTEITKIIKYSIVFNQNLCILEAGASKDACSEYYAGSKPFSESETFALSEFIKSFDIKLYMNFHSHGQFLCFPPVRSIRYEDNKHISYT